MIDHGTGGHSHLTLLRVNAFGELSAGAGAIDLGEVNANGVAIMAPNRFGAFIY